MLYSDWSEDVHFLQQYPNILLKSFGIADIVKLSEKILGGGDNSNGPLHQMAPYLIVINQLINYLIIKSN